MQIEFTPIERCHNAQGVAVVIDVLRAFTTAAYAFEAGAEEILLTATVEEALELRARFPGALAMGEVGGLPPPGFDFGNSPAALRGVNLRGRRMVQRTGAGTQGVVRCAHADVLLAASFVCAEATVRFIQRIQPKAVTFVITGTVESRDGDEDAACADYLASRLRGETLPLPSLFQRVRAAAALHNHRDANYPADIACALEVDRFPFAMRVHRRDGLLILRKEVV